MGTGKHRPISAASGQDSNEPRTFGPNENELSRMRCARAERPVPARKSCRNELAFDEPHSISSMSRVTPKLLQARYTAAWLISLTSSGRRHNKLKSSRRVLFPDC